jgi:hypothetical protein
MDDKQMLFFLHNQKCSRGSLAYFIFAHAHVLFFLKYFLVTAPLLHSSVITALSLNNHPHLLTISPPPSPPRSCLRSFFPATSSSHPTPPGRQKGQTAPAGVPAVQRSRSGVPRPCRPAIHATPPAGRQKGQTAPAGVPAVQRSRSGVPRPCRPAIHATPPAGRQKGQTAETECPVSGVPRPCRPAIQVRLPWSRSAGQPVPPAPRLRPTCDPA